MALQTQQTTKRQEEEEVEGGGGGGLPCSHCCAVTTNCCVPGVLPQCRLPLGVDDLEREPVLKDELSHFGRRQLLQSVLEQGGFLLVVLHRIVLYRIAP